MSTVIKEIFCTVTKEKIGIKASKGPQYSSDLDRMETNIEIMGTGYSITLTGSEALRLVQAVMQRLNGDYTVHDLDDDLFQAPFGPGASTNRPSNRNTWPTTTPKEAVQQYIDREAEERARMHHELHAHLGLIGEAAVHCGMTKQEFETKMKKYNIVYEPPIADDLPF